MNRARNLRILCFLLVVLAAIAAWRSGIVHKLGLENVLHAATQTQGYAKAHPLLAIGLFIGVGSLLIACSLPGTAISVLVSAGFIFGPWLGGLCGLLAMTLGSILAYGAARFIGVAWLGARISGAAAKLGASLENCKIPTLLLLRLAPGSPFWLVNLTLGVLRLNFGRFALTTLIGFVPGAFVFALAGDAVARSSHDGIFDLAILRGPQVWAPMLGLTILAGVMVIAARWKKPA